MTTKVAFRKAGRLFAAIFLLGITVIVHELGHFTAAKFCGFQVKELSLGLGPKVCGRQFHGTDYVVRCLPLGGSVQIPQMDQTLGQAWFRKGMIASAGVAMNLLLAFSIAVLIYFRGELKPFDPPVIGPLQPGALDGIQEGDRILTVAGRPVENWEELQTTTSMYAGSNPVRLELERQGKTYQVSISSWKHPRYGVMLLPLPSVQLNVFGVIRGSAADKAGVAPGDILVSVNTTPVTSVAVLQRFAQNAVKQRLLVHRDLTLLELEIVPQNGRFGIQVANQEIPAFILKRPGRHPWKRLCSEVQMMVACLKRALTARNGMAGMLGPIGIMRHLTAQLQSHWALAFNFLVLLNVNLFLINLFPLPVLDGGKIVFTVLEGMGVIVPEVIKLAGSLLSLILLSSLFLLLTYRDLKPRATVESCPTNNKQKDPTHAGK